MWRMSILLGGSILGIILRFKYVIGGSMSRIHRALVSEEWGSIGDFFFSLCAS